MMKYSRAPAHANGPPPKSLFLRPPPSKRAVIDWHVGIKGEPRSAVEMKGEGWGGGAGIDLLY